MTVLCDTNILAYSVQPDDVRFHDVQRAIHLLLDEQHELVILFQNITEFWNLSTRPKEKNGLGFTVDETRHHLQTLLGYFTILIESSQTVQEWMQLVITHQVKGVQVHDARLVAAMRANRMTQILTYNGKDFKRYTGITTLTPADVLAA